jgi:hypothetical protein
MKALNATYRLAATTAGTFNSNAQYLFFLAGAKTDETLALSGDMPRGEQFGYLLARPMLNPPLTNWGTAFSGWHTPSTQTTVMHNTPPKT